MLCKNNFHFLHQILDSCENYWKRIVMETETFEKNRTVLSKALSVLPGLSQCQTCHPTLES